MYHSVLARSGRCRSGPRWSGKPNGGDSKKSTNPKQFDFSTRYFLSYNHIQKSPLAAKPVELRSFSPGTTLFCFSCLVVSGQSPIIVSEGYLSDIYGCVSAPGFFFFFFFFFQAKGLFVVGTLEDNQIMYKGHS